MKKLLIAVIIWSVWSSCVALLDIEAKSCEGLDHIQISRIEKDKVKLFWKKQHNVTSYQIDYRKKGTSSWLIQTTGDTYLTIDHIKEPKIYEWRFRTNCKGIWSNYTKVHHFGTQTPIALPNLGKDKLGIQFYPNPTNNVLNVDCSKLFFQPKTLQILSLHGEVLLEEQGAAMSKLNVQAIPNGVYILSVSNSENVYLNKVIISH